MAAFGLRGKSLLALALVCLLAIIPAALVGWLVLQGIHQHFGDAYARNATLLQRERIYAPISRELALSLRFANSEVTRQWLLDESSVDKRALFFREAEGYRQDFRDHAYFLVNAESFNYYFNSDAEPVNDQPRYQLREGNPDDRWFFSSLSNPQPFNINVDANPQLQTTKVWFNIFVQDRQQRVIGLAGSGLDLSGFIRDFISSAEPGVSPMIVSADGAIQAHQDNNLIALNSGADSASLTESDTLFGLLGSSAERDQLRQQLLALRDTPGSVTSLPVQLDGRDQLLAASYIPELDWYVVNAIDLRAARVIDSSWLLPILGILLLLMLALILLFALTIERLLLRPLQQLKQGALALAAGRYDVRLPSSRKDEIGELSQAFGSMAGRIREHTEQLEQRVHERTHELEQANREMAAAHKKIGDSIDYASLIQRSILPDRDLLRHLGEHHAVLWKPRDVVGGDFYIFRNQDQGCLLGVVDCAGHGVPGALMTMLAHATLDQAISDCGAEDPAAILARSDDIIRHMLGDSPEARVLATNMDVGLVWVDRAARQLVFAGAKIALYYSDGQQVECLPAGKRPIAGKRPGQYQNQQLALEPQHTYYLCTDGFLDQAGGEQGYGFGNNRFAQMLRTHASLPLAEQSAAFAATLADYQGDYPQRDDITMLCFRYD